VVTGRAERPTCLWVHDGQAELRDATALWGLDTGGAEERIQSELERPSAPATPSAPTALGARSSAGVRGALPVELDHIRDVAARINARLAEGDVLHNFAQIASEEARASAAVITAGVQGDRDPPIAATFGLPLQFVAGWYELHLGFALAGLSVLRNG